VGQHPPANEGEPALASSQPPRSLRPGLRSRFSARASPARAAGQNGRQRQAVQAAFPFGFSLQNKTLKSDANYHAGGLTLLVSPSQRQSRELFSKVTDFLRSLQPVEELDEDNRLSAVLQNGSRIVSLPGDARTVRGFSGPSLIVEDEAGYVADELYAAIRPMLAVSRGRLILMGTPAGRGTGAKRRRQMDGRQSTARHHLLSRLEGEFAVGGGLWRLNH
jgi:hypothetical protein